MSKLTKQETWNDATLIGFEDGFPDWFDDAVTFSVGKTATDKKWKKLQTTFEGFFDLLTTHNEGKKDGFCYIQGELVDDRAQRLKNAVRELNILALDIDHGAPIDDLIKKIKKLGLFSIIYTSHSHMKEHTDLKSDEVKRFLKIDDLDHEIDGDDLYEYLTVVKGYDPSIVENVEAVDLPQSASGKLIRAIHAPMPKYRVVFVLQSPYLPAEAAVTHREGIEQWALKYAGVAELLETYFDRACMDVSRLFYFPRHPKGGEFEVYMINGDTLILDEIKDGDRRGYQHKYKLESTGNPLIDTLQSDLGETSEQDDDLDETSLVLRKFFAKHGTSFRIADYFADREEVRAEREEGKLIFECPFDDAHSNAGDPDDMGFCVWNPGVDDKESAAAICKHDSCYDKDRLSFTRAIMERYGDSVEELMPYVDTSNSSASSTSEILSNLRKELKTKDEEYQNDEEDDDLDIEEDERILLTLIDKIKEEEGESIDDVRAALYQLASMDPPAIEKGKWQKEIAKVAKLGVQQIRAAYKEERKNFVNDQGDTGDITDRDVLNELKKMNKHFAMVLESEKTHVMKESKPTPMKDGITLTNVKSFLDFYQNRTVRILDENSGEYKRKTLAEVWLAWPQRREYEHGIVFDPSPSFKDKKAYNRWKGWEISPGEGNCDLLLDHIYVNICHENDEWYDYFMTWLAHLIQRPWEKPGVMIALQGDKGTGKSKLVDDILNMVICNPYTYKTARLKDVLGDYNDSIEAKILLVLEEALWGGDKAMEGGLKDLLTSAQSSLRIKYRSNTKTGNYLRIISTSNEDFIVPASRKERRFFVLRVSSARRNDYEYFAEMDYQLKRQNGYAAFMKILTEWEEPEEGWLNYLKEVPKTQWLMEQVEEGMHAWEKQILEYLEIGILPGIDRMEIDEIVFDDEEENVIPILDLQKHWNHLAVGKAHDKTLKKLSTFIHEVFGILPENEYDELDQKKQRVIVFPPHHEMVKRIKEWETTND